MDHTLVNSTINDMVSYDNLLNGSMKNSYFEGTFFKCLQTSYIYTYLLLFNLHLGGISFTETEYPFETIFPIDWNPFMCRIFIVESFNSLKIWIPKFLS